MVLSGPPTPLGGAQSVPESLLLSNSALLGGQGGSLPSQSGFPSPVSSRNQFGSMNMLGNVSNVSSLLHQSFGNGGLISSFSGPGNSQRGLADNATESDPLSCVRNGMGFSTPSFVTSNMVNPNSSGQAQAQRLSNSSGNQMLPDQQKGQLLEPQNFQGNQQPMQQFSAHTNNHYQQQAYHQSVRGRVGGVGPVKMEPYVTNDQHGETSQQMQRLQNLAPVKLEPQQMQTMQGLAPVKTEPQHSDQSLYLQQEQKEQQQQQQLLNMSRQSPQAAAQINLLHQQRLLQLQHQQQLLEVIPQQGSLIRPQLQQQNISTRSPAKPVYEPGMCARRVTHYMYQQQHRSKDNSIEFWRKFVAEYFAPRAKKKWCVSKYGSGRQTTGVLPQDVWHCEICNRKPGRGFEATVEVLPRLFKIKYESGTLEELLYVDMPREYQNTSGQIILDYAKATQESVFEQLRVVRDGQLRIVFSPQLKICSWEFCAQHHEELIPRRVLMPQVSQLGAAAQKYKATTQNAFPNLSVPELQNNCNMFVASARQLAKALEVPLVNDLGYTKRYVRCLQISEVVNSMKDLIDYSREIGTGPMESLVKFPRTTSTSVFNCHTQQDEGRQGQQQTMSNNSNNEISVQTSMQLASTTGMQIVNNSLNSVPTTSSTSTIAGILHQNSMSFRQQNPISNANSPYGGDEVQILSPSSSGTIPQAQPNPSPFQSPTPSSSNNLPQTSFNTGLVAATHLNSVSSPNISMQQPALSGDFDTNDSQSSVQKMLHEIMMSSQLGGGSMMGSLGKDMKSANTLLQQSHATVHSGSNGQVANGMANNNSGMGTAGFGGLGGGVAGFGGMGSGLGQSAIVRGTMGKNLVNMNGRVDMTENISQQQDMGLPSDLGTAAGFNNLQFDWKDSP